jgi:hypothetical protein
MKKLTFCQFILICILTIVWCVIVHIHLANAVNLEGQNLIVPSTSEPQLKADSQITKQIVQTKSADNSWQIELANSMRQPSPYKPTVVFVYVRLNTISQINLPEKTADISAEVVLEWQDSRLALKTNSQKVNESLKFNGNDVNLIVGKIWTPSFTIGNEMQQRKTQNRSVQIAPNGWVRVYEQFSDVVKFDANVNSFPFIDQTLTLQIDSALDDLSSVRFSLQEFKFNSLNPSQQIIGRWSLKKIDANTKRFNRLDSNLGFPQIVILMEIQHQAQYIIFNFFIPLFIIFCAAAALTWIDPAHIASYSSPRLGGTLTLILTTIALKLSLVKEIPAVSYITLTDAVFGITVFLLLLSLITSCAIIFWKENNQKDLYKKVDVLFRKIYPFLYIGCMSFIFLFFYLIN